MAMDATAACTVAVLGAGSWGTALAALISRHGHRVVLWGRDADVVEAIDRRHENPHYLPGIALPQELRAGTDLAAVVRDADLVLVVVPSHAFAETLHALAPLRPAHAGVAWATKGFEPGSGRFLHEVAAETLGPGVPLAVVTGPSFAKEVAQGLPTALTVHSDEAGFAQLVADGMQLGLNARAGLITRGLNEMLRLNIAIGGRPETLMGLAGLGDLVLTCTGDLSRNRRLGLALGRGQTLEDAVREIGQVVESVQTADEVMRLAARHGVELPIAENVRDVLHGDITPAEGLARLLAREQKAEYPEVLFPQDAKPGR
jgi:glycerol-3-phosphate dehydrogenase (NAD(P)+)